MASLRIKELPVADFSIVLVDKEKGDCGPNTANAGFFGNYNEGSDKFTLPVGHLVCDYAADSKWVKHYCTQRDNFDGDRIRFDNANPKNGHNNPLYAKPLSTLVIKDGKASIVDAVELPEADYAISGVPVMRHGDDCKWSSYVSKQGWVTSNVRATWHTFVGVKNDPGTVYVMALKTTTTNMVKSSEAFNAFKALGFVDVIKVDGGGSFYMDVDGERTATGENRRINTIFSFKTKTNNEGTDGDMFKIALGAGHGAGTAGKRCLASLDPNETREWVLNDRICDKVEALLKGYEGYALLRLDDSDDGADDVALEERVAASNKWGADFYLSVHHNAGIDGGKGGGVVAYAYTKAMPESLEWRNELYDALIAHTGLKGNRATPKATADHYVTRMTKCPATLLELGFMDSATDVPVILTDAYAQQCAEAIVEVLVKRGKLSKKAAADKADSWASAAWEKAAKAGVLDGTRPRDSLTRQELAVVLNSLGLLDK